MQVRLLGPVDVTVHGTAQAVNGLRRKAVLAVLALHPGDVVSADRMIDLVWGEAPPVTAPNTLQSHVSHLRRVLANRDIIVARPPGYLLDLSGPDAGTDVQAAEDLIRRAAQTADLSERAARLRTALALWRGPSLADLTGLPWLEEQAARLEQLRAHVVHTLLETRLALGEHVEVIPELERTVRERPFDEPTHALLMTALYRAGRQADALAAYRRLQRTLDEELGIDPSQPLRDLESAVLRQDPSLAGEPDAVGPAPTHPDQAPQQTMPRQLPPAVPAFAGRQAELAALDALLPQGDPSAAVIVTVSGTPGVGKTTLAVHWAHRVAERFPDGQLHVNLRGFDPTGTGLDPAEALRGFVEALGIPAGRIPSGLESRTALYRSLLSGRQVLVLLDNARDAEQVRPLLPGSAGCLAVVTSRNQLAPLVAAEGAHPLSLDLLPYADAAELLAGRVGPARVAADPTAVTEIVARCARLPLALAVAAARVAGRPGFPLSALAEGLRQAGTAGLDGFDGGDPATDVRAVFSWSYRALSADAQRMFRLVGLHPGPDVSNTAAASLAGVPPPRARRLLAELTAAHLLTEPVPGRFTSHDLLRAYAAELTAERDEDADRNAAVLRLLDHYLQSAVTAVRLFNAIYQTVPVDPPLPDVSPDAPSDRASAVTWFAVEHPVLMAAVALAGRTGADRHGWLLGRFLARYLDTYAYYGDLATCQQTALAAAERLGNLQWQADSCSRLGLCELRLGQTAQCEAHLRRALELYQQVGDPAGQANAHWCLSVLAGSRRQHHEGLDHAHQAIELYRAAGDLANQARAMNGVAWSHVGLGDPRLALEIATQSLALLESSGDLASTPQVWDTIGYAQHHLGRYADAIGSYERTLALLREYGDRFLEGRTLTRLGDSHLAAGNAASARYAWRQALASLEDIGQPTDEVREKLERSGVGRRSLRSAQ